MKNDINLLRTKDVSSLGRLADKLVLIRTIGVFAIFVIGLFSFIFFFLVLASPLPALRRQETERANLLHKLYGRVSSVYVINDRTETISDILAKRQKFDTILDSLLNSLPVEVSITSIRASKDKIYLDISSTALQGIQAYTDSLLEHNKTNKMFSNITQSDMTVSSVDGSVSMELLLTI